MFSGDGNGDHQQGLGVKTQGASNILATGAYGSVPTGFMTMPNILRTAPRGLRAKAPQRVMLKGRGCAYRVADYLGAHCIVPLSSPITAQYMKILDLSNDMQTAVNQTCFPHG